MVAGTSPRRVRTLRLETGAPHSAQLPLSAVSSSHFGLPPPPTPARPRLCVFGTSEGTRRAVQARHAAELRRSSCLGGSDSVAALRLPGLPKWGQRSRSRSRQLEGTGKDRPPNSSSASHLHPLLAPALGESGVGRLVIVISSDCFVVHGFSCRPVGLSAVHASVCGSPRHTSVDDEERSAGDSGPLRTRTGIRAANARATCPGPSQRQRHRFGRSR